MAYFIYPELLIFAQHIACIVIKTMASNRISVKDNFEMSREESVQHSILHKSPGRATVIDTTKQYLPFVYIQTAAY